MILQFFDFQQGIRDNLVGERMMAMLSGFFGVLAAVLVVVGSTECSRTSSPSAGTRSVSASRWARNVDG